MCNHGAVVVLLASQRAGAGNPKLVGSSSFAFAEDAEPAGEDTGGGAAASYTGQLVAVAVALLLQQLRSLLYTLSNAARRAPEPSWCAQEAASLTLSSHPLVSSSLPSLPLPPPLPDSPTCLSHSLPP